MLSSAIVNHFKNSFEINNALAVSGGCINDCYELDTTRGRFFLKLNNAAAFPAMFEAEKRGLKLLTEAKTVRIPQVYDCGAVQGTSFILMEFIERGHAKNNSVDKFGQALAELHRHTAENFGLEHDNYIGSLPQQNGFSSSWGEFFIERRLKPMIQTAGAEMLGRPIMDGFEKLFEKLPQLFPNERAALIHGDLWSGNYFFDTNGKACLFDPAVYYGHREMDIAMSRLFGGFPAEFYEGYNNVFPLNKGWQDRIDLCNLYPILVHVNLFGAGYLGQVKSCLFKYV